MELTEKYGSTPIELSPGTDSYVFNPLLEANYELKDHHHSELNIILYQLNSNKQHYKLLLNNIKKSGFIYILTSISAKIGRDGCCLLLPPFQGNPLGTPLSN